MDTKEKIVGALTATAAVTGVLFGETYKYIFCRHEGLLSFLDVKNHMPGYYEKKQAYRDSFVKRPKMRLTIKNEWGQRLVGYYYCAGKNPCGKIAFIVHGYRSEHAETAGPIADYYFSRGWDIFACDHASHGESQGEVIGYDYYESLACLHWLDVLRQKFGQHIQIILHGFSMGGGTVLKMSDRVPSTVKFICSDSGYSDAVGMIKPNLGRWYPLFRAANKVIAGYDIEDTDVRGNLVNSRVPVLFIHGEDDPTVPCAMGKELYALCPTEKDCLFTEGAKHIESIYLYPDEYAAKLDQFIKKYTK